MRIIKEPTWRRSRSTQVSRGKMFTVHVGVDESRLISLKRTPEVVQQAIEAGATYWHTGLLPDHFKIDAHTKYDYARRATNYLKSRNKGTKPDLIFSGSLRRDLLSRVAVKTGQMAVTAVVSARVLNVVPNMSADTSDRYVKHKNGRGYPNLKREIKAVTEEEYEAIAGVVTAQLEMSYAFSPDDKSNFRLFP